MACRNIRQTSINISKMALPSQEAASFFKKRQLILDKADVYR
ncbi:hypothetical protein CHCC20335_1265 [Bacillus paralicheniformis]|nr:hypothetical protein CHCC20335_1265 [Bacillus paralicheniformis]